MNSEVDTSRDDGNVQRRKISIVSASQRLSNPVSKLYQRHQMLGECCSRDKVEEFSQEHRRRHIVCVNSDWREARSELSTCFSSDVVDEDVTVIRHRRSRFVVSKNDERLIISKASF